MTQSDNSQDKTTQEQKAERLTRKVSEHTATAAEWAEYHRALAEAFHELSTPDRDPAQSKPKMFVVYGKTGPPKSGNADFPEWQAQQLAYLAGAEIEPSRSADDETLFYLERRFDPIGEFLLDYRAQCKAAIEAAIGDDPPPDNRTNYYLMAPLKALEAWRRDKAEQVRREPAEGQATQGDAEEAPGDANKTWPNWLHAEWREVIRAYFKTGRDAFEHGDLEGLRAHFQNNACDYEIEWPAKEDEAKLRQKIYDVRRKMRDEEADPKI